MITDMVKLQSAADGRSVEEYLRTKFAVGGQWLSYTQNDIGLVEFTVNAGFSSETVYRWQVQGDSVYALNGHAIAVTPHLNKVKIGQETRLKMRTTKDEQQIHAYMKSRWTGLEHDNGGTYIPEKHDRIVIVETAAKFGLTPEKVRAIWDKVEKTMYDI